MKPTGADTGTEAVLARDSLNPDLIALYGLFGENVRDFAIILTDPDARIVGWNPGAEQILGWQGHEVIGQPASLIFTPEDCAAGVDMLEITTAATQGRATDIRWHLKKDGSRFWAEGVLIALRDAAGELHGFGKIVRDATERKRQEEALQAAHQQNHGILESISDAFYAVDAAFRFTYVNRKAEEWWGRKREDLIGQSYGSVFPAAADSESAQQHLAVMANRQPAHYEMFSPLIRRWIDVNIYPSDDGGLTVYFRDITERKQEQEALRVAYERERGIAVALQRPLTLPIETHAFPGVLLATHYEPASGEADIGGDFFDAFSLPRGRVALAVADASGKGLAAAARAVQVKEVLRAFTREYPHSLTHILSRLNDYVCDEHRSETPGPQGLFVTLLLVILDPHTGETSVVSAGAEPPLLLRASGSVERIETSDQGSLPLGVQANEMYHSTPLRLNRGDTLLLTTDGLTEARRGPREFLDIEGLAPIAQSALKETGSLAETASQIVEEVRAFGNGRFRDDVCLLLAHRQ